MEAIRNALRWVLLFWIVVGFLGKNEVLGQSNSANSTVKNLISSRLTTELPEETGLDLNLWIFCILYRIQTLDEKKGKLSLEMATGVTWRDKRLRWETGNEGVQEYLTIPSERIWNPPILVFNKASDDYKKRVMPTYLRNVGDVTQFAERIVHLVCIPNMRWFPFDQHECPLQVSTWNPEGVVFQPYKTNEKSLNKEPRRFLQSRGTIKRNPYWQVISSEDNVDTNSKIGGLNVPMLTSKLVIRRNAPIHAVGLLCPVLASAILGLASFCLPPIRGSRMAMIVTANLLIMYSLHCLHILVGSGRGGMPYIAVFSATCQILLLATCLQSIIVSFIVGLKSNPPAFVKKIIQCFPSRILILCGLGLEASDLYRKNEEDELLEDSSELPDKIVFSWVNVVVVLDVLSMFVHFVIVLVITCAAIITE